MIRTWRRIFPLGVRGPFVLSRSRAVQGKTFHATDFYNRAKEFRRDTPKRQESFDLYSRLIPKMNPRSG